LMELEVAAVYLAVKLVKTLDQSSFALDAVRGVFKIDIIAVEWF